MATQLKNIENGQYMESTPYVDMDMNEKKAFDEMDKGQIEIPDDGGVQDPDYVQFSWQKLWIFTGPGASVHLSSL